MSDWGNYDDVSLNNLDGYYTNISVNGTPQYTDGFKSSKNLVTSSEIDTLLLLTTGSTEAVKKMNLYDVAGNLAEWTSEASYVKNANYETDNYYNTYVLRGGCWGNSSHIYSSCYRAWDCAPITSTYMGFRVALYLE